MGESKEEIRNLINQSLLQKIAEIGSDMDKKSELIEIEEHQASGAIRGFNDAISLISQLTVAHKENEDITNFSKDAISRLKVLQERLKIIVIQKQAKKEICNEFIKSMEEQYKVIEAKRDSLNIGTHPNKRPKVNKVERRKNKKIIQEETNNA